MKLVASIAAVALALCAAPAFAQTTAPNDDNAARGARGHGKAGFIATYDADSDSVVTRAEFDARRNEHYARADANRDGTVTEEEYVAEYQARLDADIAAMRERQLRQARVRFGVLDTDRDARMSAAEFGASGQRMFTRLDTNQDGTVDERDTAEHY